MHEMSLAEGIVQIIEDEAKKQSFQRVKAVWLEIGKLAGVDVEAMKFCFDVVTKESVAANAVLHIIDVQAVAWCMMCAKSVDISERYDPCPDCGGYQLQPTGGDEMRIKELEVD